MKPLWKTFWWPLWGPTYEKTSVDISVKTSVGIYVKETSISQLWMAVRRLLWKLMWRSQYRCVGSTYKINPRKKKKSIEFDNIITVCQHLGRISIEVRARGYKALLC